MECLSVIWWLSTFAWIASLAAAFTIVDDDCGIYGYGYCYVRRALKARALQARSVDIAGCYKGAAALGAFEWALFVGTLITFSM
jgi:hypothetical protein